VATLFTIDASVFVAACRPSEAEHNACRALLRAVRKLDIPMIEPAIVAVEIVAALRRTGDDPDGAQAYAFSVLELPRLTVVTVDGKLARQAVEIAVRHRLRGADALYVTVAARYGASLVTLDAEQLKRAPASAGACKPQAALARL